MDTCGSLVRTDDGSFTWLHPELGETYHARQGAVSEAEAKFIHPTRLRERLHEGPVRILDIGFGLGVNCRAALACEAPHGLYIDSIERETEALDRGLLAFPEDPLILALKEHGCTPQVHLHLGDLRTILPRFDVPYDVIFHDPFSPLKNTEAWTVEVFQLLKALTHPKGILATYSESRVIRSAMAEAGWIVGQSPPSPPHRGGTLCAQDPTLLHFPLESDQFRTEPYRDPGLQDTGKQLRSRREALLRLSVSDITT
jgi:tRNA U34 5-methylaminomethyl-2-thiouridine-forming methyltransferase MnmC